MLSVSYCAYQKTLIAMFENSPKIKLQTRQSAVEFNYKIERNNFLMYINNKEIYTWSN